MGRPSPPSSPSPPSPSSAAAAASSDNRSGGSKGSTNSVLGVKKPTKKNMTSLVALANSSVNLPCDISVPNNRERVSLILWYREDLGVPIFR